MRNISPLYVEAKHYKYIFITASQFEVNFWFSSYTIDDLDISSKAWWLFSFVFNVYVITIIMSCHVEQYKNPKLLMMSPKLRYLFWVSVPSARQWIQTSIGASPDRLTPVTTLEPWWCSLRSSFPSSWPLLSARWI